MRVLSSFSCTSIAIKVLIKPEPVLVNGIDSARLGIDSRAPEKVYKYGLSSDGQSSVLYRSQMHEHTILLRCFLVTILRVEAEAGGRVETFGG
jgi:hypothetical protein